MDNTSSARAVSAAASELYGPARQSAMPFQQDSLLVRFQEPSEADRLAGILTPRAWLGGPIALVPGLREVRLPLGTTVADALAIYGQHEAVTYAEPNFFVQLDEVFANDPGFASTWGLHNTGQSGGTPDADIDATNAWAITTGSTSTVAGVIDTGIQYTHEDLYQNIWINQREIPAAIRNAVQDVDGDGVITFRDLNASANQNLVTDRNGNGRIDAHDLLNDPAWANGQDTDGNGYVDDLIGWNFAAGSNNPLDDHSHGTHIAGTIGAVGNNGIGVAGINWSTQLMALKFMNSSLSGTLTGAINALNYAVAMGASVSNNSFGGLNSQSYYDAIRAAGQMGHVFVTSAGNENANNDTTNHFPSNYDLPNILVAAATNRNDAKASFSNYGATTVDLGAPGESIYSTWNNGSYGTKSGTSMAAPHVTGAVALVQSLRPDWGVDQVIDAILGGVDPVSSLAGKTVSGGRLNAYNAVVTAVTPGPEIYVSQDGRNIPSGASVEFGNTLTGLPISFTFTVKNVGVDPDPSTNTLELGGVAVPAGFTLVTGLQTTQLAALESSTFTVRLDATTPGVYSGLILLPNNDNDESPFAYTVSGTVLADASVRILDDGDVGFRTLGVWSRSTTLGGFQDDVIWKATGNGQTNWSKWEFVVRPGEYRVAATWPAQSYWASNTPFTVSDGTTALGTVPVNQTKSPSGFTDQGKNWQVLGTFTVSSNMLVVTMTDGASGSYVCADAIRIERISATNNPPTALTATPNPASLAENSDTTTSIKVADLVVSDDGMGSNFLSLAGDDAASFVIVGTELHLTSGVFLDYETKPTYRVTVHVDDPEVGSTPDASVVFVLNLIEVNEPPMVSLANTVTALAENTTAQTKIADIVITDDGVGTNVLSLSGPDAALFEIVGLELFLKAGQTVDYETNPVLNVIVEVNDAELPPDPNDTAELVIAVIDVNEPPTAVAADPNPASLAANADTNNSVKVADLTISDDALGTNTLSLAGDDAVWFVIVGSELHVAAGVTLDYQTQATYSVTVNVDDPTVGTTPDASAVFVLNLIDVNQPPTAHAQAVATKRNTSVAVTLSGSDPEGAALQYSVVAQPAYGTLSGTTPNLTYTPQENYSGSDGFTFKVNDGVLDSPPATVTITVNGGPKVSARALFYNGSAFDGGAVEANSLDDDAIATDKQALLPGQTASFANYTSYSKGLNGLMIDISDLPPETTELTSADFEFRVGNSDDPSTWDTAAEPASITMRPGAGMDGSTRITLIWADHQAVKKQWLQVTVKATAATGLDEPDVFYFGNAPGDSGNSPGNTLVDGTDFAGARDNSRNLANRAPIDFRFDYNRDSYVDGSDVAIARENVTSFLTALKLITAPAVALAGAPAGQALAEGEGEANREGESVGEATGVILLMGAWSHSETAPSLPAMPLATMTPWETPGGAGLAARAVEPLASHQDAAARALKAGPLAVRRAERGHVWDVVWEAPVSDLLEPMLDEIAAATTRLRAP